MSTDRVLYFPDILNRPRDPSSSTSDEIEPANDPSAAFFELANVPWVGYRIPADDGADAPAAVMVRQNNSVQEHTGGIVWETSYLLAAFLIERYGRPASETNAGSNQDNNHPLGKTLEIGSGCGMLGLVLAASGICRRVVLTETTEVMHDLCENVKRNIRGEDTDRRGGACLARSQVASRQLRWDELKADIDSCKKDDGSDDLQKHSFDTIVGTDVVFDVRFVKPLLCCLAKMAHEHTLIYLCLQVRCADSHALLLKLTPTFGMRVEDCSEELRDMPSCSWGLELECKLLRFVVEKKKSTIEKEKGKEKKMKKKHSKDCVEKHKGKRRRING